MATWAFIELSTVLNPDRYNGQGLSKDFLASVGSARKIARYLIQWVDSEYYISRKPTNSNEISETTIANMAECYLLDVAAAIYAGVVALDDNDGLCYMLTSDGPRYWPWLKELAAKRMRAKGGPATWAEAMTEAASDRNNQPGRDMVPIDPTIILRVLERHFATPVLARRMEESWDSIVPRKIDEYIGFPEHWCDGMRVIARKSSRQKKTSIGKIPFILFSFPPNIFFADLIPGGTLNDFLSPFDTDIPPSLYSEVTGKWSDFDKRPQNSYVDYMDRSAEDDE